MEFCKWKFAYNGVQKWWEIEEYFIRRVNEERELGGEREGQWGQEIGRAHV